MTEAVSLLETFSDRTLLFVAAALLMILGWIVIYAIRLGSKLIIQWRDSIAVSLVNFNHNHDKLKKEYEIAFSDIKKELEHIVKKISSDKAEYIEASAEVRAATMGLKAECMKIEKMLQATLLTLEAKIGSVVEMKESYEETRGRIISVENFIRTASEKLRNKKNG